MKQVVKKTVSVLGVLVLCITLLSGCGSNKTLLFSFGDDKIYTDEAWIYFYLSKYSYESSYTGIDWTMEFPDETGETSTMEELVKQQTLSTIKYSKLLSAKAKEEELTLTEEELEQAKTGAATVFEAWTGKEKKELGITQASIQAVFEEQMLAQKYQVEASAKIEVKLDKDDYRVYNTYNLMFPTFKADDDNNKVDMSKAEKAKQLKKAKAALKKIKAGTEIRQIETGDESGSISFTKNGDDVDQTYKEAALKLKTGELSEIIETESGYHIIEMFSDNDEEQTKEKEAALKQEKQLEEFYAEIDKLLEEKEGEWDFETDVNQEAWASISFVDETPEATTGELTTGGEATTAADAESTTEATTASEAENTTEESTAATTSTGK